MRKGFRIILCTGILILSGCQSKKEIKTEIQEAAEMNYDFNVFEKVKISGIDLTKLSEEEASVLYVQAMYCQAMCDADIDTMRKIVAEDTTFTHMSGKVQSREEYFADVESGALTYYTIGIKDPKIEINGDKAEITYTSVLNANAYGARGTFHMKGTHHYRKIDGVWILVNR